MGESSDGRFVALRFVGGNRTAEASSKGCARDGYGARVTLRVGDRAIVREHHCGDGMAARNSRTVVVGIGPVDRVDSLEIRWPCGEMARSGPIEAGALVTLYEDRTESANGTGFKVEPYTPARPRPEIERKLPKLDLPGGGSGAIRMYTAMATTCQACAAELPHMRWIREKMKGDQLEMYGVPVDLKDSPESLRAYQEKHNPAYQLLADLPRTKVLIVKEWIRKLLGGDGQPATIVTDAEGGILYVGWGVPHLSELRKLSRR